MSRRSVLAGLVVLVGALPLLVTQPAPLQDWPNHLARIHILTALLDGVPFWARFYRFSGFLVPNATMDAALLGLVRAGLGVPAAATLFLLAVYAVFVAGFCALARTLGGDDPVKPAFAVLLFYGYALFWGLVSYVLGVGLLLCLLAAYGAATRRGLRLGLAGAGSVALLFTHAVPAVLAVAALGCFDLVRFVGRRGPLARRLLDSAGWVVALAMVAGLLHAMPGDTGHDLTGGYSGVGLRAIVGRKLLLFAKALLGGSWGQDAASLLALLTCIGVVLTGHARLAAAPALTVLVLIGATLAAPEHVGTGSLLDQRLAILPLIVAAAAVRLQVPAPAQWLATGAVLLRTLVLSWQFHAAGAVFRDFRERSASLPSGSAMLMAHGVPLPSLSWQTIWAPPLTSLATQVVFRDIFMPHIFANPGQQPIALRPEFDDLTQPWDLTDVAHMHDTAAALAAICTARRFAGVYLTVLYPGAFAAAAAGPALIVARPDFLILDGCRLAASRMQ